VAQENPLMDLVNGDTWLLGNVAETLDAVNQQLGGLRDMCDSLLESGLLNVESKPFVESMGAVIRQMRSGVRSLHDQTKATMAAREQAVQALATMTHAPGEEREH